MKGYPATGSASALMPVLLRRGLSVAPGPVKRASCLRHIALGIRGGLLTSEVAQAALYSMSRPSVESLRQLERAGLTLRSGLGGIFNCSRAFQTTMGTRLTGKYLNDATAKDELVKRLKV